MPDITMCNAGKGLLVCPRRNMCYRFTAKPSEYRQAYFTAAPFETEHPDVCDHFWQVENKPLGGLQT